jgi:hypothetical protein
MRLAEDGTLFGYLTRMVTGDRRVWLSAARAARTAWRFLNTCLKH